MLDTEIMTTPRNSPVADELFIVEHAADPTRRLVYVPLRSYLAAVPVEVALALTDQRPSRLKDSFRERVAAKPKVDIIEVLTALQHAPPELSLAITDNCNLRCVYCHNSAGDPHKTGAMPREVIRAVIDAYFSQVTSLPNEVCISFNGGGEPTFAHAELDFAINHALSAAANVHKRVTFMMATNGFYGDHIREYVVQHFRTVSLSLDGPAFIQNRHRPTASGGDSFDRVHGTAKYFATHSFPFAFRATVSAFSLPHLRSVVDFIADEFPGRSVGLEHLNPFGRAERSIDPLVVPPDKSAFADAIAGLIDYAKDRNVMILNSASTEYNLVRPVFCTNIGVPNWTVSTTGEIVACGRDKAPELFVFGRFNRETGRVDIDRDRVDRLQSLNVLEYPECQDCFCKYHCAGGLSRQTLGGQVRLRLHKAYCQTGPYEYSGWQISAHGGRYGLWR